MYLVYPIYPICVHAWAPRHAAARPAAPSPTAAAAVDTVAAVAAFPLQTCFEIVRFFQQHTRAAAILAALVFGFSCVHRNDNTCVHVCMRAWT